MLEQLLSDLLQQIDLSSVQEIFQEFDPIEIFAYGSVAVASLGASLQTGALTLWRKIDKPAGFFLHTFCWSRYG